MSTDFRYRFSALAHEHLPYCNPISPITLDHVLDHLSIVVRPHVLDLGCGRADLLIRLAERFDAVGLGVDLSHPFLDEAKRRIAMRRPNADITLHLGDIRDLQVDRTFDVVACVGGPFERVTAVWLALRRFTRPGGYLLWGGPYWRQDPDPDYLAFLDMVADGYGTHDENLREATALGLVSIAAVETSQDEWDHYEDTYAGTIERYVVDHPGDPDGAAMLARIRPWRHAYLRWGRQTLGFGLYLWHVRRT